jgi:hypothetical protein
MKLLKIIFLPALLFASYFFFTYAYSPSILTTGIGFKPSKSSTVAKINDPFLITNDSELGSVYLCASTADDIMTRLKNSSLVARNEKEIKLFPTLQNKDFEVADIQNNTYYYNFKINDMEGKKLTYNVFNCNKVERIKTNNPTTEKSVVGYLGTLVSKEEYNDVIWLLDSIGAFKSENTERSVKEVELLDTGDDFMRINSGIDTYMDLANFKFYKNMYNQAFTYSKVTGVLTHELVLDLFPSRSK